MSSLTASINASITTSDYTATVDYPEESCMYHGEISLIPAKTSAKLSPLEAKVRQYAVNLENGHLVHHTLVRLNQLRTKLSLFEKYNIRKLANKFLYKSETTDQVVKLAERIKYMEKMESKRIFLDHAENGMIKVESSAPPTGSSSGSSSGSTSPPSDSENFFLAGSINISSTLDRLLKFVKKTEAEFN